jgi:multicomponent Na+:H+ antiporter subunit G
MSILRDLFSLILMLGGLFFFFVGTMGLIRLPDVLTRMHATTKADTLGAGLIVLGVVVYFGFSLASLKALLILAFIWLTNPTAAHIIAKAVVQKDKEIQDDSSL